MSMVSLVGTSVLDFLEGGTGNTGEECTKE